jgi:hypothetical protein
MRVLPEAGIDPGLLAEWAAAWAVSRGKPGPVPVHNGFYLLDGRPGQIARYVFPDLRPKVVAAMTARITEPFVFLKWCAALIMKPGARFWTGRLRRRTDICSRRHRTGR